MEKAKYKKCRHCRQLIPEDADKCYQCNEWQCRTESANPVQPQNIWGLTGSKEQILRALGLLSGVVAILILGAFIAFFLLKLTLPFGTSIELKPEGSIVFTKLGEDKKAVFLLSPNGTRQGEIISPWVSTGIKVKKGDKIILTASGRVSFNIHHTVDAAKADEVPISPWSSPDGFLISKWKGKRNIDEARFKYALEPDAYYGELIGQIVPEENLRENLPPLKPSNSKINRIGSNGRIDVLEDGILYLTVNEVWLTTDKNDKAFENSRKAYLPDKEGNELYYLDRAEKNLIADLSNFSEAIRSNMENQDKLDKFRKSEKKDEGEEFWKALTKAVDNGFETQEKRWEDIVSRRYDDLWYDDNIGSFSVNIKIVEE